MVCSSWESGSGWSLWTGAAGVSAARLRPAGTLGSPLSHRHAMRWRDALYGQTEISEDFGGISKPATARSRHECYGRIASTRAIRPELRRSLGSVRNPRLHQLCLSNTRSQQVPDRGRSFPSQSAHLRGRHREETNGLPFPCSRCFGDTGDSGARAQYITTPAREKTAEESARTEAIAKDATSINAISLFNCVQHAVEKTPNWPCPHEDSTSYPTHLGRP